VELYRRESGFWVLRESGPGETIGLSSIGATLDMAMIYEDVDWSGADEDDLAP